MLEYMKYGLIYFSVGAFLALLWGLFTVLKEIWIELAKQTKLKELELGITDEMKSRNLAKLKRD
jgi:hypothetical protein